MSKPRQKSTCPICYKLISNSNISKHIASHETHPEYHKESIWSVKHEGLICCYCGKECKNTNSLCNHERLCSMNPNRQTLNLVNYIGVSHEAWNKGLTIEDERVQKNAISIREHYKQNPSPRRGVPLPQHVKDKISNTILDKAARGEWHTSLAKNMHYTYKGEDLHGTWELEYAKYLDTNGIKWVRNKKRFTYYFEGKRHYYTPDFYLQESDTFIEIKGLQTARDEAKWKQFPPSEKLQVLFYHDLISLGIDVKN